MASLGKYLDGETVQNSAWHVEEVVALNVTFNGDGNQTSESAHPTEITETQPATTVIILYETLGRLLRASCPWSEALQSMMTMMARGWRRSGFQSHFTQQVFLMAIGNNAYIHWRKN